MTTDRLIAQGLRGPPRLDQFTPLVELNHAIAKSEILGRIALLEFFLGRGNGPIDLLKLFLPILFGDRVFGCRRSHAASNISRSIGAKHRCMCGSE